MDGGETWLARRVRAWMPDFGGYTFGMMASAIVADAEILNGIPCFRGTRVPFRNLLDYLEGGHSLDEFLDHFPTVERELAVEAIAQAGRSLLAAIS